MIYEFIARLLITYLIFAFVYWDWEWFEDSDKRLNFLLSIVLSYILSYLWMVV